MPTITDQHRKYWHSHFQDWKVQPDLLLSEWANENFYLTEGDANAGKWTTLPYQVDPLNAIVDPAVERITFMKSTRVGYTRMILISFGYHVDYDPCPQIIVQPTLDDARGFSKDDLQPVLDEVPVLIGKVSEAKSRDKDNTILKKSYRGGPLNIVGANSARGFRRIRGKIIYFDEASGYPPTAGQEGDQIALGIKRTNDYHDRKIIIGSTPTFRGDRIDLSYESSDKRRFFVPCPYCKHKQYLVWKNIDFSTKGTVNDPKYICESCRKAISYEKQRWMIERGEWIATAPFSGHAGFHIWAAYSYSPNATWRKIVEEFLESKDNRDKLQVWTNTVLGDPFEDQGETLDWEVIAARREKYDAQIPKDGLFLVMTIDVQKHYVIGEVSAIGKGEESFGIEFFFENGNPEQGEVWEKLRRKLESKYEHESGLALGIAITVIDSGNWTDQVYKFVKSVSGKRIYAIKGGSVSNLPRIGIPTTKNRYRIPVFTVGTDTIKNTIFNRLNDVTKPGHGYLHFPDYYPDEYFDQLTAEEKKKTFVRGVQVERYVKVRPRNEALDLNVYKYAAIEILNPNYDAIEENLNMQAVKAKQPEADNQKQQRLQRPKKNNWVNNWKG